MRPGPESLLLVLVLAGPAASAQDSLLEGHSGHGEVFNEGPRQAAYLMGGTGAVSFPVTVAEPELRALFEQGLGQLHGFWYFEAERSFRQVAARDPDCAMAYWGMALANVENPDRARGFARVAWLKRGLADERERMYIDAYARFFGAEGPDEPELEAEAGGDPGSDEDAAEEGDDEELEPLLTVAEREAEAEREREERAELKERAARLVSDLDELVWEHPDDLEAKALLVNQLWMNRYFDLDIPSRQANEALLQQILAVEPMHPAHHYRIHLWDQEDNAERVVEAAVKSGPSAPSIAHMWHMGGHVFARLGRHADAAWQQEASARVDHAFMLRDRVLPDQIHNFAHNNEWLTRSLRHQGRVAEAVDLARNMIELPRHPRYNTLDQRACSASYGRLRLLEALSLHEQWQELVELADTMYLEPSEEATDGALRAFALGVAWAHLEDAGAAAEPDGTGGGAEGAGFDAQVAALERMLADSKRRRAEALDEAEERAVALDFEGEDLRAVQEDVLDEYERELDDVRGKLEELRALRAVLDGAADAREQLEVLAEGLYDRSQLALLYLRVAAGLAGWERDELLEQAVELAREGAEDAEGRVRPHATLAHVLRECDRGEEAFEAFERLRPWAARADLELAPLARLAPIANELGLPADWRPAPAVAEDLGDVRERVDLATLGPLRWTPPPAPDWELEDAFGERLALADYSGRPVVVIFFLGFGCVHCVEQLVEFAPAADAFAEGGIDIVAIGTDTAEELRASFGDGPLDTGYPFPVLADPELEHFRAYRAHDDFEDAPLHGTFLVDGRGRMRWQDVSYEPFMDWEFLLEESQRLLGLDVPPTARTPLPSAEDAEHARPDPAVGSTVLGRAAGVSR